MPVASLEDKFIVLMSDSNICTFTGKVTDHQRVS